MGISVIITTYKREATLLNLLISILNQKKSFPLEIILINNNPDKKINKSIFTGLGRNLMKFDDIKIFNSTHNYGCFIRYSVATIAKYDTILLLDDDIDLINSNFIQHYYDNLKLFSENDIISAWCANYNEKNIGYYETIPFSFNQKIDKVIEVDLVGPGICMFNKKILFSEVLNIPEKFQNADNVWFSLMSTYYCKSKKYYIPAFEMVKIVDLPLTMHNDGNIYNLKQEVSEFLLNRYYKPLYMQ